MSDLRDPPPRHGSEQGRHGLQRAVDDAARSDESPGARQRNAGLAIAVLALIVVALLIAIVTGAMPRP